MGDFELQTTVARPSSFAVDARHGLVLVAGNDEMEVLSLHSGKTVGAPII